MDDVFIDTVNCDGVGETTDPELGRVIGELEVFLNIIGRLQFPLVCPDWCHFDDVTESDCQYDNDEDNDFDWTVTAAGDSLLPYDNTYHTEFGHALMAVLGQGGDNSKARTKSKVSKDTKIRGSLLD